MKLKIIILSVILFIGYATLNIAGAKWFHKSPAFWFLPNYDHNNVVESWQIIFKTFDTNTNISDISILPPKSVVKIELEGEKMNMVLFTPDTVKTDLEDKVEILPSKWSDVDANCDRDDVTFIYNNQEYTWAWCNSTLGGNGYHTMDGHNGTYAWVNAYIYYCSSSHWWYNSSYLLKEINISWACKIDNIMWKLYQWRYSNKWMYYDCKWWNFIWETNNSNCPCQQWWHVPTNSEWNALISYYGSASSQWWSNASTWNLTYDIWLPLAGMCGYGNNQCRNRWSYWYYRTSTNPSTEPYYRNIGYGSAGINTNTTLQWSLFSVRCIKDY